MSPFAWEDEAMTGTALRGGRGFATARSLGRGFLLLTLLAALAAPLGACHGGYRTGSCAVACRAPCPPPGRSVVPAVYLTADSSMKPCASWPKYTGSVGSAEDLLVDIENRAKSRLAQPNGDPDARLLWTAVSAQCAKQRTHGSTCTKYTCAQLYARVRAARLLALAEDWETAFAVLHHVE